MSTTIHMSRIGNTWANVLANLAAGQTALLIDQLNEHVHKVGSEFFFPAMSKKTTDGISFTYLDAFHDDGTFYGDNVDIGQYLRHESDTDTFLRFTADALNITCGGVSMVDFIGGALGYIKFFTDKLKIGYSGYTEIARSLRVGSIGAVDPGIGCGIFQYAQDAVTSITIDNQQDDAAAYAQLNFVGYQNSASIRIGRSTGQLEIGNNTQGVLIQSSAVDGDILFKVGDGESNLVEILRMRTGNLDIQVAKKLELNNVLIFNSCNTVGAGGALESPTSIATATYNCVEITPTEDAQYYTLLTTSAVNGQIITVTNADSTYYARIIVCAAVYSYVLHKGFSIMLKYSTALSGWSPMDHMVGTCW